MVLDARVDKHPGTIGEQEERIGCRDRTGGAIGTIGQRVGALDGKMAGVHAVDLAHADANRGLVVGQQDGVGLHAADCTPCEHEVLQRVSVGGLAGHELPGVRIVADGVDQISVLHKKQAAIDLADGLVALRRLSHLEDAQVLLLGLQQFERGRLIVGATMTSVKIGRTLSAISRVTFGGCEAITPP